MFIFNSPKGRELKRKIKAYKELAGEEPKIRVVAGSWTFDGDVCRVGSRALRAEFIEPSLELSIELQPGEVHYIRPEDVDGLILTFGNP